MTPSEEIASSDNPGPPPLIACRDCDLLQREVELPSGGSARCPRCGALLYRHAPNSLDRTLAYIMAAAVLYGVANIYPIVGLGSQGMVKTTTLWGGVHALWSQHMHSISLLVLCTTIVAPVVEIAAVIYLLLPIRLGHIPPGLANLLRARQRARTWNMIEVFMLGVLVSLVKLQSYAKVIPGIALWSFAGVTLLLAAAGASFNPRILWNRMDESGERRRQ